MTGNKKPVRILCLDDDPSPPAAFKCVLEPHGYEVVTTTSSMEALTIMQTATVDLLIQDVNRPDMSGITLYGIMKADERLQNIPVVICSGTGVRKFLDHYPDVAGALEKPFEVEHLLDVVRNALEPVADKRGDVARPGDKKPKRILCVDDEPHMLGVYRCILEPHGYEVVTTLDSIEALRIMLREPVDLLIQDLARPAVNGFELYAMMRANERLKNVPVVICSGYDESRSRFLERFPDVARVLAKPIDAEVLLDAVRKALPPVAVKRGDEVPGAKIVYNVSQKEETKGWVRAKVKDAEGKVLHTTGYFPVWEHAKKEAQTYIDDLPPREPPSAAPEEPAKIVYNVNKEGLQSDRAPKWIERVAFVLARLVVAGMLGAATNRQSRDYYTLLHWAVSLTALWGSFFMGRLGRGGWMIFFGVTALFFNPILPVHLRRETWANIDIIWSLAFLLSTAFLWPAGVARNFFAKLKRKNAERKRV